MVPSTMEKNKRIKEEDVLLFFLHVMPVRKVSLIDKVAF